jgi:hypothetical protein
MTDRSTSPDTLTIARNMAQSPDNWPPMRVKQVAEAYIAADAGRVRAKALEEAAKVADEAAQHEREEIAEAKKALDKQHDHNSYGAGYDAGALATAENIAEAIRGLKQEGVADSLPGATKERSTP